MAETVLQAFLSDLVKNPDNEAPKMTITDSGQPYDLHNVDEGKRLATVVNNKKRTNSAKTETSENPYVRRSVQPGSQKAGNQTQTKKGIRKEKTERSVGSDPTRVQKKSAVKTPQATAYQEPVSPERVPPIPQPPVLNVGPVEEIRRLVEFLLSQLPSPRG